MKPLCMAVCLGGTAGANVCGHRNNGRQRHRLGRPHRRCGRYEHFPERHTECGLSF